MTVWTSLFRAVSAVTPSCVSNGAVKTYFKLNALWTVGLRGYHSQQKQISEASMKIRILPALSDNYMYLLVCNETKQAAIVDPVAPDTVLAAVAEEGVSLTNLLTTHHHWDHAGGNKQLIEQLGDPSLQVVGGDERIDGVTRFANHGDEFKIGSLTVTCLFTPCHTTGHFCYYVRGPGDRDKAVFTGDTLFIGGCGRFFEGTAEQMYNALVKVLSELPGDTKVYCGHEYAIQNLSFGLSVEPENQDIAKKLAWVKEQREASPPLPSVPSTIEEERRINPFVRVCEPSVQSKVGESDPVLTMRAVRLLKDNFKL